MKTKKLEWIEAEDELPSAKAIFGHYVIWPHYFHAELEIRTGSMSSASLARHMQFDAGTTIDEIKEGCQRDHDKRILEWIEAGDDSE